MDDIEYQVRFLRKNRTIISDNKYKAELKRLIDLVEGKQLKNCIEHYNGLTSIQNTPRISEQVDWEEL